MKKNLFYLFALICSMSLFTACSDDDKVNTSLNTSYASSELELIYGGEVMLGKKVSFNTTDGVNGTVTLEGAELALTLTKATMPSSELVNSGVIPGESLVSFPVALQTTESGYTFEGTHASSSYSFDYKGAVEAGKLSLDLSNVKLLGDNALVGTWNLQEFDPWGEDRPLHAVWDSEQPFSVVMFPFPGAQPVELQPGGFITLISSIGLIPVGDENVNINEVLSYLLKSVTFKEDGNIVASYSDAANLASPQFQNSPLNLVQYALKNKKLYLYLNVEAIIAATQQVATKALDAETILPLVLPKLMELIPMLSNGIPLGYTVEEGALSVYIDNELGLKIVDILLPLLENEEVGAAIKEAATSNPDFAAFAGVVDAILEQAPAVLGKTTKMELGLNFVK